MDAPYRTLAVLVAVLAASPALAQPDASWTESGDVTILVRTLEGAFGGRDAEDVLETDTIEEITVGDSGLIGNQQTGTLRIEGVGDLETPRHLGDVFVLVGLLELNGVFVDQNFLRIGVSVESQFTDLSEGTLSVVLSEIEDDVTVRNGYLACQASRIAGVTVLERGHAQISGCNVEAFSSTAGAEVSVDGSTIDAGLPNFRGDVVIRNSTITSTMGTVTDGTIEIGRSGEPVDWDASGTITLATSLIPTAMIVTESAIQSSFASIRGGSGGASFDMQGAAFWRTTGLFQFQGTSLTADVNSASAIQADTDVWIGGASVTVRSGVDTDSRIDVAGDFGLGNFDIDTFTSGTLTIEDGGYVDVDGTFTIRPAATLNLNGGTLRVGAFDNQGTFSENGGTLIVPEPTAPGVAALLALAAAARRRSRR